MADIDSYRQSIANRTAADMVSMAFREMGKLGSTEREYLVEEDELAGSGPLEVNALVLDGPSAIAATNQSIRVAAGQAASNMPSLAPLVTAIVNQALSTGDSSPLAVMERAFQAIHNMRTQLSTQQLRDLQAQVAERLRLEGVIVGAQLFSGVTLFGQVERGIQVQLANNQVYTINLSGNAVPFSAASYIDTSTLPVSVSQPDLAGSTTIRFQDVVTNFQLPPPAIDFTQAHSFITPDDPSVRSLLSEIFPPPNGMVGLSEDQIITVIYNYMQGHFTYMADARDHWSTMAETILRGGGDCEDLTNLAASLAVSALGPDQASRISVSAYLNTETGIGHTVLNYTDSHGTVRALDLTGGQVLDSITDATVSMFAGEQTVSGAYRLYFTYGVGGTVLAHGIDQSELSTFTTATQTGPTLSLVAQIESAMFTGTNSFGNLETNINTYFNNLNTENTTSPYWSYSTTATGSRYRLMNYDRLQEDYQRILMQMQILTTFMSIAYLVADIIEKSAYDMTGEYQEGQSAQRKKVQEKFGEYTSKINEHNTQMQDLFIQAIDDYNEAEYRETMEDIEEAHSGLDSQCEDIWGADADRIQKQEEKIAAATAYANIVQANRRSVTNTRIQMLGAEYLADGTQANNMDGQFNQVTNAAGQTTNFQTQRDQLRTGSVFSADGHVDTVSGTSANYNRFNSNLFMTTRQSMEIMNERRKAWFMVQEILLNAIEGAAQEMADVVGTGRKVVSGKKVGMAAYSFEQARMGLEQAWLGNVQRYAQTEMGLRNNIRQMQIELQQLSDPARRAMRFFQGIFQLAATIVGIIAAGFAMTGAGAPVAAVLGIIAIALSFVGGIFGIAESGISRDLANSTAQEAATDQLNQANYAQLLNAGYGAAELDENEPGLTEDERRLRRNLNAERRAMNDLINLENQLINVGGGRLALDRNRQLEIRVRLQLAQEAIRSWVMVQLLIADAIRTAAADMANRQKAEWSGKEKDIIDERYGMVSAVLQMVNFDLNQLIWANRNNAQVSETRFQKNVQFEKSFWNLWPGVGQTAGPVHATQHNYNYNLYSSGNVSPGALTGSQFGMASTNPYDKETQPDLHDAWEELNIFREASNRSLIATGDYATGMFGTTTIRPNVSDGVSHTAANAGLNLAGGVDYDFFNQQAKRLADIQMRRFARIFVQSFIASMIMSVAGQLKGRATMSLESANYAQQAVERQGQLGMECLGYMKALAADREQLNNMQFNASREYAQSEYNAWFGFLLTSSIGKPVASIMFNAIHGQLTNTLDYNAATMATLYGSGSQTVYSANGGGLFETAGAAVGNITEDFRLINAMYENRSDRRLYYGNATSGFGGVNMNWENVVATKIAIRNNQLARAAILRAVETALAFILDVASSLSGGGVAGLPSGVLTSMVKYQESVSNFQFSNIQSKDELRNRITNARYADLRGAVVAGIELIIAIILFIIQMVTLGAGNTATSASGSKGVAATGQTPQSAASLGNAAAVPTTPGTVGTPAPVSATPGTGTTGGGATASGAVDKTSASRAVRNTRIRQALGIILNLALAVAQDLTKTIFHEIYTQEIKRAAQQYRRGGARPTQFAASVSTMMGTGAPIAGARSVSNPIAMGAMEAAMFRSQFSTFNAGTMADFWSTIASNTGVFSQALKNAVEKILAQIKKQGNNSSAAKGEWMNNKAEELLEKAIQAKGLGDGAFKAAMADYQRFMSSVMNERAVRGSNFATAARHAAATSGTNAADRLGVRVPEGMGKGVGNRLIDRAMQRVRARGDTADYSATKQLGQDVNGRNLTTVLTDGEPKFPVIPDGATDAKIMTALDDYMGKKVTYLKALRTLADEEKAALSASRAGRIKLALLKMSGYDAPLSDFVQNYTSATAGMLMSILAAGGDTLSAKSRSMIMSRLIEIMGVASNAHLRNITSDLAQVMATVSRRETILRVKDGGFSAARITDLYGELMKSKDEKIQMLGAQILASDDSVPLGKMEVVVKAFTAPDGRLDAEGMLRFLEKMPEAGVAVNKPGLASNMLGAITLYAKAERLGRGSSGIVGRIRDALAKMHAADPIREGKLKAAADLAKDYEVRFMQRQTLNSFKSILSIPSQFISWQQSARMVWDISGGKTKFDQSVLYSRQAVCESIYSFYGKNEQRLRGQVDAVTREVSGGADMTAPVTDRLDIVKYFDQVSGKTGMNFSTVGQQAMKAFDSGRAMSWGNLSLMARRHAIGSALADDLTSMIFAGEKVPKRHMNDMLAFLAKNNIDLTQNPTFRARMAQLHDTLRLGKEGARSANLAGCLRQLDADALRRRPPRIGAATNVLPPLADIVSGPLDAAPAATAFGQFAVAGQGLLGLQWNETRRLAGQTFLTEAEGGLRQLEVGIGRFRMGMDQDQLREFRRASRDTLKTQRKRIQDALSPMLTSLGVLGGDAHAKQLMKAKTMPELQRAISGAVGTLDTRSAGWIRGAVTDVVRDFQTSRFVTHAIGVGDRPLATMRRAMFETLVQRPDVLMVRSRVLLANHPEALAAFERATGPDSVFGMRAAIGGLVGTPQLDVATITALPSVRALARVAQVGGMTLERTQYVVNGALTGTPADQLGGLSKLEKVLYDTVSDARGVHQAIGGNLNPADAAKITQRLSESPVARHFFSSLSPQLQSQALRHAIQNDHPQLTVALLNSLSPADRVTVLTDALGHLESTLPTARLQTIKSVLDQIQKSDPRLLAEVASRQFLPGAMSQVSNAPGFWANMPASLAAPYKTAHANVPTATPPRFDAGLPEGALTLDILLYSTVVTQQERAGTTIGGWLLRGDQARIGELIKRMGDYRDPQTAVNLSGPLVSPYRDSFIRICENLSQTPAGAAAFGGSLGEVSRILGTDAPGQAAMGRILHNLHQHDQQGFSDLLVREMMNATPQGRGALMVELQRAWGGPQALTGAFDGLTPWVSPKGLAMQNLSMSGITEADIGNLSDAATRDRVWNSYQYGLAGLSQVVAADAVLARRFATDIAALQDVMPDQMNVDQLTRFSSVLHEVQTSIGATSPLNTPAMATLRGSLQSLTGQVDGALADYGAKLVLAGDPFSEDILTRMYKQAPHLAAAVDAAGKRQDPTNWGQRFAAIAVRMLNGMAESLKEAETERDKRRASGTDDEESDRQLGRLARVYKLLIDTVRQSPPVGNTPSQTTQLLQTHNDRLRRVQESMLNAEMETLSEDISGGRLQAGSAALQRRVAQLIALLPAGTPASVSQLVTDLYTNTPAVGVPGIQTALGDLALSVQIPRDQQARMTEAILLRAMQVVDLPRRPPDFVGADTAVFEGAMRVLVPILSQDQPRFAQALQQDREILRYTISHHMDRILALDETQLDRVVAHARRAGQYSQFFDQWREVALSEHGPRLASGLVRALTYTAQHNDRQGFDLAVRQALMGGGDGVPLERLIPYANEAVLARLLSVSQGVTGLGGTLDLVAFLVPRLLSERPEVLDRFFSDRRIDGVHKDAVGRLIENAVCLDGPDRHRYLDQLRRLSEETLNTVLRGSWGRHGAREAGFDDDAMKGLFEVAMEQPAIMARFVTALSGANQDDVFRLLGEGNALAGMYRLLDAVKGDDGFRPLVDSLMGHGFRPQVDQLLAEQPQLLLGVREVSPLETNPLERPLRDAWGNAQARARLITAFAATSDIRVISNFLNVAGQINPQFCVEALTRLAKDNPDTMIRMAWSLPKDGDDRMTWVREAVIASLKDQNTDWTLHQQLRLVGSVLGMDTGRFPQTGDYQDQMRAIQSWVIEHIQPSANMDISSGTWTGQRGQDYRDIISAWSDSFHGSVVLGPELARLSDFMDLCQPQTTSRSVMAVLAQAPESRLRELVGMMSQARWAATPENVGFLTQLAAHIDPSQMSAGHPRELATTLREVVAARALALNLQLSAGMPQLQLTQVHPLSQLVFGQPLLTYTVNGLHVSLAEKVKNLQDRVGRAQAAGVDASVLHTQYLAFSEVLSQVSHQRSATLRTPLVRSGSVDDQQLSSDVNALARFRTPQEIQAINVAVLSQFLSPAHPQLASPSTGDIVGVANGTGLSLSSHILNPTDVNLLLDRMVLPVTGLQVQKVAGFNPTQIRQAITTQIVNISALSQLPNFDLGQIDLPSLANPDVFRDYLLGRNGNQNPAALYLGGLSATGDLAVNQRLIEEWLTHIMTRPTPLSRKAKFEVPAQLITYLETLYKRDPQAAEEILASMEGKIDVLIRTSGVMGLYAMPMAMAFHKLLLKFSRDTAMGGSLFLQRVLDRDRDEIAHAFGGVFAQLPQPPLGGTLTEDDLQTQKKGIRIARKLLDRFVELGDDALTMRILNEFEMNGVPVTHRVMLDAQIANWVADFSRFIATEGRSHYRPEDMQIEAQMLGEVVGSTFQHLSLMDRQYVAQKLLSQCSADLKTAVTKAADAKASAGDRTRVQLMIAKLEQLLAQTHTTASDVQTTVRDAVMAASQLPPGTLNDITVRALAGMIAVSDLDFDRHPDLLERLVPVLQTHGVDVMRQALRQNGEYRMAERFDAGLHVFIRRGTASYDVTQAVRSVTDGMSKASDAELVRRLLIYSGDDQVHVLEALMASDSRALTRVWQALTHSQNPEARQLQGAFLAAVVADPSLQKDLFLYMRAHKKARDGILTVMRDLLAEQRAVAGQPAARPLTHAIERYLSTHDSASFVDKNGLSKGVDVLARLIKGSLETEGNDSADPLGNEWMMHFIQSLAEVRESVIVVEHAQQMRNALDHIFERCPDLFFHPAFNHVSGNYWARLVSRNFFSPSFRNPFHLSMRRPGRDGLRGVFKPQLSTRAHSPVGATMDAGFPPLLSRLIQQAGLGDAETQKANKKQLFGLLRYILLEEKQKFLTKNAIRFKEQLIHEMAENHPELYLEFLGSKVLDAKNGEVDRLLSVSHYVYTDAQRDRLATLLLTAPKTTIDLEESQRATFLAYLLIGESAKRPLIHGRMQRYYNEIVNKAADPSVADRFVESMLAMEAVLGHDPFRDEILPALNKLKEHARLSASASVGGRWAAFNIVYDPANDPANIAHVAVVLQEALRAYVPAEQKEFLDTFLLEYARHQTPQQAEAVLQRLLALGAPIFNAAEVRNSFVKGVSQRIRAEDYGQTTAVRRSPLEEIIGMQKQKLTDLSAITQVERIEEIMKGVISTLGRISGVSVKVPLAS